MNIFIVSSISFLLYLMPIALVTGPFVPDFFLVIVSMLSIIYILRNKLWHYYQNKFFIFFLVWCLYLIILSLSSVNPLLSLESSLFYFRYGFFVTAVWLILNENNKFLKY